MSATTSLSDQRLERTIERIEGTVERIEEAVPVVRSIRIGLEKGAARRHRTCASLRR